MASKLHVRILKTRAKDWNSWRYQNRHTIPDLSRANLSGADLSATDLSRSNLKGAYLYSADLTGADLSGADLRRANLTLADLSSADLTGANLQDATLELADLSDAHLSEARLTRSDLSGTDLRRTHLNDADLTNSTLGWTRIGNVDLSDVKGLDTVKHKGPSTIGVDTIYLSKGQIPEGFLLGAGVPANFVTYLKSLVVNPIEYYSCFISYSDKDGDFAKRLYADLQGQSVRCWFAPEDLKIGDRFRRKIDEAIRVYDKLLIVLSKGSVRSRWVETEVEAAFEKERKQRRTVLFPIRLDEAAMETKEAWAAELRRTRHIGDFREWKQHDLYKKAFDRLLRDLRSEA